MIKHKELKTPCIAILVVIACAVFYYIFDPLEWSFMPQCIFHKITGLQCVGCGSQRMIHALLHGDLHGAFAANAFALVSLPFLGALLWLELNRKRHPRLYASVHRRWVIIAIAILLMAWMLLRNLLGL